MIHYLDENRTEGCTVQALERALKNGHDEAVKWLLVKWKDIRVTAAFDALLLHAQHELWSLVRDVWGFTGHPDVQGDGHLGELLECAGREGKFTAVRFIVSSMGKRHQLHRVVEGAVVIGSVGFLMALAELMDKGDTWCVRFEIALQRAIEGALIAHERHRTAMEERLVAIKWLAMHSDKSMEEIHTMAIALTESEEATQYYYSVQREIGEDLAAWCASYSVDTATMMLESMRTTYFTGGFHFALFGEKYDWVMEYVMAKILTPAESSYEEEQDDDEKDKWVGWPATWASRAIERGDLDAVKLCHQLSQMYPGDSQLSWNNDDVLMWTIASGDLVLEQWCVRDCYDGCVDADWLLATAVEFGSPVVADWLLANLPQCCTAISGDHFNVRDKFATVTILVWLDNLVSTHPHLVKHVQPKFITESFAGAGNLNLLKRWMQTYKTKIASQLYELLDAAAYSGELSVVQFVVEAINHQSTTKSCTQEEDQALQRAMGNAAEKGALPVVQYLFKQFPDTTCHFVVNEAARGNHVPILRFLFMNGYETSTEAYDILHGSSRVRCIAYLCEAQGPQFL